ncbi:sulfatase-like hydrolase/transferase [Blastomonas sp.]|uniref:sulfatase-like hydrolase/transferase n=1 Tax=Blastomonas sp. TaxID=1909299 RepID=UPI00406A2497
MISRREALAAMAAALGDYSTALAADGSRPNILCLVSEDNNPFLGCYGDTVVRTPNIDALAAKGVLFRHAYASAPVCAPSRFGLLTGVHAESCSPAQHMRATAKLPPDIRTYPELMRSAGYYCTNNAKTDYNCDVDPARLWDETSPTAHWRKRTGGKPFLAVFNYMVTHESQLFRQVPGRVKPSDVRVPGFLPDTAEIREDYAGYYNLMERMDTQIGERLAELKADGLADDTIVFYYSDNGGVLPRSKRFCYDEGLRCALIVHVPEKWRHLAPAGPGTVINSPVSLIDLPATLLSIAGVRKPPLMQSNAFLGRDATGPRQYAFAMRNRMDECIDFCRTVTDGRYRYIRNYMPHRPWGQHLGFAWTLKSYQSWETEYRAGRTTPEQSRFFKTKPYEELYDLQSDPDQLNNLIGDSGQRANARRLRAALNRHMLAIHDNGFIPEGADAEGFFASRNPALYPLKRVMMIADIAARRDVRKIAVLNRSLDDANPVIRFWAANGLVMLGRQAAPALAKLQHLVRTDPSDHVRVAAAEALALLDDPQGVATLGAMIVSKSPVAVRLLALNALIVLGERARPALAEIAEASTDKEEYIFRSASYVKALLDGSYRPDMSTMRGTTAG